MTYLLNHLGSWDVILLVGNFAYNNNY